uniref:FH2 domain-containing protein n=1 Tax=Panagrolaimus sp. PS1159 TaxID=55785 RepID=A0AC35F3Y4_9BILA
MTTQPMNASLRDPEVLQQFLKQHALVRQFQQQQQQSGSGISALSSLQTSFKTIDSPSSIGKPSETSSAANDKKRGYPYTFQYCVLCQKNVHSSKLPCHIRQCHVGKPMFQCPACDFTSTYSKNNVKSHMVSLHGITGDPISYMDEYAEQVEEFMKKCFPNVRGRARPFPGRTQNNNNNNNNSSNTNRNNSTKSRPRAAPSPKVAPAPPEPRYPSQNVSPSSLILPKFPFFNNTIGNIHEKSQEKIIPEVKEEMADIETSMKDETSSIIRDFFTPSNASEKAESTANFSNSFIENEQALYTNFPHRFVCSSNIKGTVFETFTNSSDLIDRIDLTEMAVFFENNNRSLLNSEQIRIVSEIRRQLPKKDFEIMFALYKRFKTFCETNSVSALSEEEKFVIELSNIEQLFIRLRLMETIHSFPEMIYNLQQEINTLRDVAITLRADTFFTIILQCSTIYTNFLCGDFGAQLIHGVRVNEALNVCKYELPNGIKIGKRIADMLPINALGDTVAKRLKLYQEASQYNFSTLENRVKKLGECLLQLDAERSNLGTDCAPSSVGIVVQEARLRESLTTAQNEMTATLQYFAETSPTTSSTDTIKPEHFIKNVIELLQFLINVC